MKLVFIACLVGALSVIECNHTFLGTNVQRPLVYHHILEYGSHVLRKRVENLYYTLPNVQYSGKTIQGILALDLTKSTASANVTNGGIGFNFLNLRMKSERGEPIRFEVYIYT